MFLEARAVDPADAVVAQGTGLEPNGLELGFAAVLECLADEFQDLFLGCVVVLVAHLGTDEVGEFLVVSGEGLGHDVCGLLLLVVLPAVGDHGKVEEVADVGGRIVQAP